ncbi:hypothetical protein [Gynuella sunshinyii]|uniref:Uncharacterized protein n=1 Tax=Gynuella sunshinyii YC6258 TaxID=1445510 RepID=A0A0C5VJU2_9GAMM|nr:hypothetical protein [Gynuella sunshinyii]AJQ94937.1 hypothetical Protein YC6258_02899 [Gynuella sunshinyii YC6258]
MQSSAQNISYQEIHESSLLSLDTLDFTFKTLRPINARAALEIQNLRQKGLRIAKGQTSHCHVDWDLDKVAEIIHLLTLAEAPKVHGEQICLTQTMEDWIKLGRQLLAS